ncbi:LOW QUALITY PROTEIN: hypothetical protein BT93_H1089 [Corymbia citriodora subsp. variegata]|nr:LOW QUALITY PROTEIN: hypothetical protein BT93_H1089 [Corymbia citriodora subsp. variegata]
MKEFWTSLASLLGALASLMSILQMVLPPELWLATFKFLNRALNYFSSYCYYDVAEMDGINTNELYNAVKLYLSSFVSASSCSRLSLTRAIDSSATTFGFSNNDCINDVFNGVAVQWEYLVTQGQSQPFSWQPLPDEKRCFTLRIQKRDRDLILDSYLDFIMDKANNIRRKNQQRLLYTNSRGRSLDSRGPTLGFGAHLSTFDTLAMDSEKKRNIMEDLGNFDTRQALYQQTGEARKRHYLLYGPPGTGPSSMIAAMANFLGYDIYNLELTEVPSNSELQNLLRKTNANSIIVIKDIDWLVNPSNRSKVLHGGEDGNNDNFWGLLDFHDGLWSCCGSERIFVYTTDHFKKLDPALLESSRMDMHICMG